MKNKKTIIGILILVMTLSVVYIASNIGAWLTDKDETDPIVLQVGEVKYTLSGAIDGTGYKVPGQNLVLGNNLKITNGSNVNSEIRLKYEFTYLVGSVATDAKPFLVGDAAVFNSNWVYDSLDDFYYLTIGGNTVITPAMTTAYDVITNLTLDGLVVGNTLANTKFTLKITFQAKQAEYLSWADTGSIDFSVGL